MFGSGVNHAISAYDSDGIAVFAKSACDLSGNLIGYVWLMAV
jgi:hypothetical protein